MRRREGSRRLWSGPALSSVFYGNIGSVDRLDFTVVGPAVNETSRIAAMCQSVDRSVVLSSEFVTATPEPERATLVSVGRCALPGVGRAQVLFTIDPAVVAGRASASGNISISGDGYERPFRGLLRMTATKIRPDIRARFDPCRLLNETYDHESQWEPVVTEADPGRDAQCVGSTARELADARSIAISYRVERSRTCSRRRRRPGVQASALPGSSRPLSAMKSLATPPASCTRNRPPITSQELQ